jgi:SSS family transporter
LAGVSAEFWDNGPQMAWVSFAMPFLAVPVVAYLFVGIYSRLKLVTAYEYLEKRFHISIRTLASLLFLLFRGSYIAIVLFGSAFVFAPAYQVHPVWIAVGIGIFAMLYAMIGGMKSVIWTDVIQMTVIYGGLIWMLFSLCSSIDGGWAGVWQIAEEHGRGISVFGRESYWSFSMFERTTFWGLLLGYWFMEIAGMGTDQITVQRFMTTGSAKDSVRSIWTYSWMAMIVCVILWVTAAALFAFYKQHPERFDPSISSNGILSFYILNEVPHGLSGIFMAAVMAAVLGTVNAGLNCLATASLTDFHLRFSTKQYTEKQKVLFARLWTAAWGFLTIAVSVLILLSTKENMVRVTAEVLGLFSGILLAIFLLGVITQRANTPGVLIGSILGLAIVFYANYFWTRVGADGKIIHISFIWPCAIGTISTFIFGYAASLFFQKPSTRQIQGLTVFTPEPLSFEEPLVCAISEESGDEIGLEQ